MFDRPGTDSLRHWGRIVLIAATIGGILYIIVAAWVVLVPFLLGLILAWIVVPAVDWFERLLPCSLHPHGIARLLAILIIYAGVLGIIVLFAMLFLPTLIAEIRLFVSRLPALYRDLSTSLSGLRRFYESTFPPSLRATIQQQLPTTSEELLATLEKNALAILARTVRTSLPVIAGYVIVPFWLIYVIYDAGRFRRATLGVFTENSLPDVTNIARIINVVAGAYVRGQLLVAISIGALTGLALSLLGVDFAATLGALTAVGDLIPTFGPIIAAIPVVIIAALEAPILAVWAVLAIVGIRELEDLFVGPRVLGSAVRIRPALIIVLLLVAGFLWGLLGLLLVVPVYAVLRDVFRYLYLRTSPRRILPSEAFREVSRAWRRQSY